MKKIFLLLLIIIALVPTVNAVVTPDLCWNLNNNTDEVCQAEHKYDFETILSDATASGKIQGGRDYELSNLDEDFVNDSTSLSLSTSTFCQGTYFNTESFQAGDNVEIMCHNRAGNFVCIGQNIIGENNKICARLNGQAGACSDLGFNVSEWYHAATVYDNEVLYLYINGQLKATQAGAYTPASNLDEISFGGRGAAIHYDGKIDEPFLIRGNCTESMISEIYNRTQSWGTAADKIGRAHV